MTASEIEDPELARYLNRSYWEQKQQEKENREKDTEVQTIYPSAPVTASVPLSPSNSGMKTVEVLISLQRSLTLLYLLTLICGTEIPKWRNR